MNEYISYQDLDDYQNLDEGDADKIEQLRVFCEVASRMFDGSTHRVFYPRIATRYYDMPDNARRLKVDDDLLEVTLFTTQNGDETMLEASYYLMCGTSYNLTPYDRIVLKIDSTQPNLLYSGTPQKSQAVTATWGYHESWSDAWESSNDALAAAITSTTATTVSVADADGADVYGFTPRFKVQQLIKVDDEMMYVTVVTAASANQLTVVRGVNGSTAATHTQSAAIYIYRPMTEIAHAVKHLAAWLYANRDTPLTKQIVSVPGRTTITIPDEAPLDVKAIAARYKR